MPKTQTANTVTATVSVAARWAISTATVRRTKRCTGEFITSPCCLAFTRAGNHDLAHTGT